MRCSRLRPIPQIVGDHTNEPLQVQGDLASYTFAFCKKLLG
jgi:hypothetical protein